jgi:tetratricopeptide (TPR) repeat protein
VEALVKLGRTEPALGRLDAVAPAALARSPALRVLRGELRARAGRLAAAVEDFDLALGRGAGSGDLFERALYGRGSCRARQGDAAGAREDLERYLRLHPQGRFAAEARQVLGR